MNEFGYHRPHVFVRAPMQAYGLYVDWLLQESGDVGTPSVITGTSAAVAHACLPFEENNCCNVHAVPLLLTLASYIVIIMLLCI